MVKVFYRYIRAILRVLWISHFNIMDSSNHNDRNNQICDDDGYCNRCNKYCIKNYKEKKNVE